MLDRPHGVDRRAQLRRNRNESVTIVLAVAQIEAAVALMLRADAGDVGAARRRL
jgi:hypothetical protein